MWGQNNHGQLGLGDNRDRNTPQPLDIPEKIIQVAAGVGHVLALTEDEEVYAW